MDVKEKLVELLSVDCCPNDGCYFCDYAEFEGCRPHFLADHLIANGVTVQENAEISDELFKRLRDAPITVGKEESSIEPVQEWIPVTERLPEIGRKCLIANREIVVRGWLRPDGVWKTGVSSDEVWSKFSLFPPTHWMPLPQPPKGE